MKFSAFLFTLIAAFSLDASMVNEQCVKGHELCSEHMKQSEYAPTYHDMIKNKTHVTDYLAPKVAPSAPVKLAPAAKAAVAPAVIVAAVEKKALDDDHDGVNNDLDECPKTPLGYKVDAKGCAKSVTYHFNFATASSVLPKSSIKEVNTLIEFMKENTPAVIMIIGHTDNVGSVSSNLKLSKSRANALATKLISSGIAAERIKTDGKGLSEPIATNKTKAGRAQNRRIDVKIE